MRVNVIDLVGIESGIVECARHGLSGAGTLVIGLGDVSAVRTGPVTQDFGINSSVAGLGMFEFFKNLIYFPNKTKNAPRMTFMC